MKSVPSRELRNHTADLLGRVADGESLIVTVNGSPAALLAPLPGPRRPYLTRNELVSILDTATADPGLARDLDELASETTDDLDDPA